MKKTALLLYGLLHLSQATLTGAIDWSSPPTQISTNGFDASFPQIAVDSQGNTIALWVEEDKVKSRNLPFSGSWGSTTVISSTTASYPSLVVDPSGNATSIWLENGIVKTANQPFSGSWSSASSISSSGASEPQLAVDSSGNLVAVWARNGYIESATQLFGGSWSSVDVISGMVSDSPQVAIGDNGNVVAVWHSVVTSTDTIISANKAISGTWNSPTTISTALVNSILPQIAVNSSGDALAIWFTYSTISGSLYQDVALQSAYQTYTQSWGTPEDRNFPGIANPTLLHSNVAFDGNLNAVVSWNTSNDGSLYGFQLAIKPANGAWGGELDVVEGNLFATSSDLAVDSSGHAQAIYLYYDNYLETLNIGANQIDIYAVTPLLTSPALLSNGTYNDSPQVATNSDSSNIYTAGAWIGHNGSNLVIQASTGSGELYPPPITPSVVQGSQNFQVFTEYYNTVSWTESPEPSTISYLIYRNGTYITNVSAPTTEYVDHNQVQNGSVVYGVAALNSDYGQSDTVTVSYP